MSDYLGLELCGELDFYPASGQGARGPLTGPTHAAIVLEKTDTHSSYQFDYQWKREVTKKQFSLRTISVTMDTPGSKTNRRLSTEIMLDDAAKSVRAYFTTPIKSAEVNGKYEYNELLKGADVILVVDGSEIGSVRAALRSDVKGPSGRYEPSLAVTLRNRNILHFQGYFSYQHGSKYGYDFQLKHLTARPIRLNGNYSMLNVSVVVC